MNYFAYGSNMAPARLRARVGEATLIGVYRPAGHDLRFHKIGRDGSAKCDAFRTGNAGDRVQGVVFELDPSALPVLDRIEGLGDGYARQRVELFDLDRRALEAFKYLATRTDPALRPFSWYRNHVLVGARNAGLSRDYIARIEAVEAQADPDRDREARETGIHRGSHHNHNPHRQIRNG